MSGSRQVERNEIFVIVVLVVRTQTDEDGQFLVLQVGDVLLHGICMDKHFQPFILTDVEGGVLIDGLRLSVAQILHHHVECLLIAFHQLWLCRILFTADSRRQHVVHRRLLVVLFNVHRTHGKVTAF